MILACQTVQRNALPNSMEQVRQPSSVKCYTAEEVGEAVGLEKVQVTKEVCSFSESILKTNKVQFSDDYQVPSVFLQHGTRINHCFLKNRKKVGHQRVHKEVLII